MPFSDELREFFYIVWEAVQTIPEGKITSYGHIASLVGSPTRSRQVGLALKNLPTNPELEFNTQNVPWHRVVNAGGKISARAREGACRAQADALREEGVQVDTTEMGEFKLSFSRYGWFPTIMPSGQREAAEV